MKSKLLGIASVVAAGALVLTACGSGTPPQTSGPPTDLPDDVITIEFWQNAFSNEDNAWYTWAVEQFNASQDKIFVNHQIVPGDAWDQKLTAAQAAGLAPDMYTMNYSAVPMKARNGELAPITSLIAASSWADLDQRFLDAVTVNGEQYAYPLLYEPSALLYYRVDAFEAAGLDPNNPPKTWAELIDVGLKLNASNGDVVPFQLAQNAVELSWTTWSSQYGTAGHLPISDDWSTSRADDPAYKDLFQFYKDLYDKGVIAKQPLGPYGDATPLGEGNLAMMLNGSWGISLLLNDFPDQISNIRVAASPTIDGNPSRASSTLGGWTIGVDAKSEKKAEAAAAISWILAEDVDVPKQYFIDTVFTKLSPRTSVTDALLADPQRSVNPFYEVLVAATESAILEPTYDWQVSFAMGTALEKAMLGGSVDEALAEAHAEITRVINELGLADQLK